MIKLVVGRKAIVTEYTVEWSKQWKSIASTIVNRAASTMGLV